MIVLCVKSVVVFGIDQEKFCAIVKNYQSKSFGVSNELKLQKLRRNRKKDFSNSFNSKNFDWRGIIEEIDSVGSE